MTVMHMTKNVGKPYEGKLHVRFDEGELKVKQRPAKESLLEISPLLYFRNLFRRSTRTPNGT